MLNIFKKNEKVDNTPTDLKQEEQRLLKELEEVRERMKFESVQNRNTDNIEQAFKNAGYEFTLSPHPAMWDKNYTLLMIKNAKNNVVATGHHKPDELNELLNNLDSHLDTVVSLLKPQEQFNDVDSVYIGQNKISISRDITYNSPRNSWYGTCKISIVDNCATISAHLEHFVPAEDIVQFPNGVVRGVYSDDGRTPIIVYKIKQNGVNLKDVCDTMKDMHKRLCETIKENDE